ncbi:hypothetical protein GCM10011344_01460 [Dokdonia pacifica]|uniref:Uncharacterized protein n=1 Tax=Dokdonia pacifica TaxID=1627892 RepID=A0A238Z780_9FLAO|nr:hypothetical protein [Dokdonia pacifica]GGG04806.1 hypothetical protein GCM10011344_01460 [Dokdonia pacifica]SNR79247.1 hypothetical protein SAMN06265376_1036 [Dokdonia pacifica]
MNRIYITLLILTLCITSCTEKDTTFSVTNEAVGAITKATKTSDLDALFKGPNDSLVKTASANYVLYEKGGNKLMKLSPKKNDNDIIDHIQFFDDRYTTENGISLKSTFEDIKNAYTIKKISNMIDFIIVFVEESEVYFIIDKKHLSSEVRFSTSSKLEPVQVPGEAPIKHFMFTWPLK